MIDRHQGAARGSENVGRKRGTKIERSGGIQRGGIEKREYVN